MEIGRTNNAIPKHVEEVGHAIDWEEACFLKKGKKKLYPKNILESYYIKRNRRISMNVIDRFFASVHCGKGEGAWLQRGERRKINEGMRRTIYS